MDQTVVGDLAHGQFRPCAITYQEVAELIRNKLAYEVVQAMDADEIDMDQRSASALSAAHRNDIIRSMSVAATATTVTRTLLLSGVRAMVYKGPTLAMSTTGSWRGRGSADVDVLVSTRDTSTAHAALTRAGLRRRDGNSKPPSTFLRYRDCERAFVGLPATVDLHWRIEATPGSLRLDFNDLWDRRRDWTHDSLDAPGPGATDEILMIAVHGVKERWALGRWQLDATRLVESVPMGGWADVQSRAREANCARAVDIMLGVVLTVGGELPADRRPTEAAQRIARQWIDLPRAAHSDKNYRVSFRRRLDRFHAANSAGSAIDGWVRAAFRQASPDGEKPAGSRVRLR